MTKVENPTRTSSSKIKAGRSFIIIVIGGGHYSKEELQESGQLKIRTQFPELLGLLALGLQDTVVENMH